MRLSNYLAFLIPLAFGCTSLSPVSESHPIVGGTRDTGDPAVVEVVYRQDGFRLCTGTVIAPHVVLTAAHCVDEAVIGTFPAEIFTGDDVDDPTQYSDDRLWVDAKAAYIHPTWDLANVEEAPDVFDLGIIITKAALAPAPLPLLRRAITTTDIGRTVRFVGFGRTNPNSSATSGKKFERGSTITELFGTEIWTDDPDGLPQLCHGDSGGPVLLQEGSREMVVGVNSTVADSVNCTGPNHHDRVDNAWDFIEPLIEAADPGFLDATPPDMAPSTLPDMLAAPKPDLLPATMPDLGPTSDAGAPENTKTGCHVTAGGASASELAILLPLAAWCVRRRRSAVAR